MSAAIKLLKKQQFKESTGLNTIAIIIDFLFEDFYIDHLTANRISKIFNLIWMYHNIME